MRIPSIIASFVVLPALLGCNGGGGGGPGTARWPKASTLKATALPTGASWHGVWFINTPGSRGTMHVLETNDGKFHGCWMAEDKHARATFVGTLNDNIAMFDWTQKRIGFAGAPERVTAYLVMEPQDDGRHKVSGEYGVDLANDAGNRWEGIKQKNQEPKEDGCKIEEGDTVPTDVKPLQ
jgi:hypothetical protein